MLTILYKIFKFIAKVLAEILVFSGLWIAALYSLGFFIAFFIQGWSWDAVSVWYYLGLGITLVLGFMWFVRFKLKIGRRKKDKDKEKSK